MGQSEDETRALILRFYEAFSRKDATFLAQSVTDDWQDIPLAPGQADGPEGIAPIMAMLAEGLPDASVIIDDLLICGEDVAARCRITGTHAGLFFGIAPTGRPVEIRLHEFHKIRDGRISHTWHLEDWFGMLNQLGAWPPAANPEVA